MWPASSSTNKDRFIDLAEKNCRLPVDTFNADLALRHFILFFFEKVERRVQSLSGGSWCAGAVAAAASPFASIGAIDGRRGQLSTSNN
jgi:hypothetical protein